MKILLKENVFDAALNRIRYLFKEFPTVIAGVSGGKDSTVIFNLTMRVARELGRLPLPVFWLDQEAEWTDTVNYCRWLMYQPDVKPLWFQMPMHLDNAASLTCSRARFRRSTGCVMSFIRIFPGRQAFRLLSRGWGPRAGPIGSSWRRYPASCEAWGFAAYW
jgi:hypothetical protein